MAKPRLLQIATTTSRPEVFEKPVPKREPVQLSPIAWGERDEALARVLCRHLVDAMPPIVIRFNPVTDARLRSTLRHLHIHIA